MRTIYSLLEHVMQARNVAQSSIINRSYSFIHSTFDVVQLALTHSTSVRCSGLILQMVQGQLKSKVMEKIEETRRLLGLDVVVRRLDGDRATAENTPLLKLLDMHQEMSGNVASKKKNLNKKDMVRLLPCDNPCECVCRTRLMPAVSCSSSATMSCSSR